MALHRSPPHALLVAALLPAAWLASPGAAEDKPAPDPAVVRAPVPAASAVAAAQRQLRESLQGLYPSRMPEDLAALGRQLLARTSEKPNDAVFCYACRREALDVFVSAGDLTSAFAAADALAQDFVVSAGELKAEAFNTALRQFHAPEDANRVLPPGAKLAGDLLAAGDLDRAKKLCSLIESRLAGTQDEFLALHVRWMLKEPSVQLADWDQVQPALRKLQVSPADADANLTGGRYYALSRGDWARALPFLAQCGKPLLVAAAKKDLARPQQPLARLEAGEAWWAAADKEYGSFKPALLGRAAEWYVQALPDVTGHAKLTLEVRIQVAAAAHQAAAKARAASGLLAWRPGLIRAVKIKEGASGVMLCSPNGRVVSLLNGRNVSLYDLETGHLVRSIALHQWSFGIVFSPDGTRLVATHPPSRTVEVWDLLPKHPAVSASYQLDDRPWKVAFTPEGRLLAATTTGKPDVSVADLATEKKVPWTGTFRSERSLAWSPEASRLLLVGRSPENVAELLDATSGKCLATFVPRQDEVFRPWHALAHSPDGKWCLIGSGPEAAEETALNVYSTESGKLVWSHSPAAKVGAALAGAPAFLADGERLAVSYRDNTVRVFDFTAGREAFKFDCPGGPRALAASPDGLFLLVSCSDGNLRLFGLPK